MSSNRIVVWDPENEFWEGALTDEATERSLKPRGAVLLPVAPELFAFSGIAGFVKRAWGSGWPCDPRYPRAHAKMTMYVPQKYKLVHWVARLYATDEITEQFRNGEFQGDGQLRLIGDVEQFGSRNAGVVTNEQPIAIRSLPKPDTYGGWTIGGTAELRTPSDGFYGFAIYGVANGFRIAWSAMSVDTKVDQ